MTAYTFKALASFNSNNGATPYGGLIMDANGDLLGTTYGGGANNDGTVFEIAKTAGGYAGTPITLLSLDTSSGANPLGGLVADANGDLFGTTQNRGANGYGTVFELAQTNTGYASTATTLRQLQPLGRGQLQCRVDCGQKR